MQTIKVSVKGAKTIGLDKLNELQGGLKRLPDINYQKLKSNILKHGITEPITIWENRGKSYIVNGHMRLQALARMVKEGHVCPRIPVSVMEAKNLKDAKRKLLSLASQYGVFSDDGVNSFLEGTDISLNELADSFEFAGFDLNSFISSFEEEQPKKEEKETEDETVETAEASTKRIQLVFDSASAIEFMMLVEELKEKYGTENITDTVFTAVKQAYQKKTVLRKKAKEE